MKKNIFKISIVLIIIIALFQLKVLAENVTVELLTDKENYRVNDTVIATVSLGEEDIQAVDFSLQYDATKLEFKNSSINSEFYTITEDTENINTILISWVSIADRQEDIVNLSNITFTFTAIQKGQAQINIGNVEIMANSNLEIPDTINYLEKGTKVITINTIGDINLDDKIDNKDLEELEKYINGNATLEGEALQNADINMDEKVDKIDLKNLQDYIEGTIEHLPFLYGDLNFDGNVNIRDLSSLRKYLSGESDVELNEEQLLCADLNLDGIINNCDLTILKRFVAGGYVVGGKLPVDIIVNDNLVVSTIENKAIISGFENTNMFSSNLLNNFTTDYTSKVYDITGTQLATNARVGTGTVIKVNETTVEEDEGSFGEYTVIIYGDTNGDGDITAVDALAIVKNKLEITLFSNKIFEQAGRTTKGTRNSGQIPSAIDALAIVKDKLELEKISQK